MSVMDEKSRFDFLDLAKGVAICMIVWGHTLRPRPVILYAFDMPLFFFISGILHREKPARDFFAGRVRRLYYPYLLFFTLSWLFYLTVMMLRGQHDRVLQHWGRLLSLVDGSARNGGNDSIWYLTCLMTTSSLSWVLGRLKRPMWQWGCVAGASVAGFILGSYGITLPFKLDVALTGLVFYQLGQEAGKRNIWHRTGKLDWLPLGLILLGLGALQVLTAFANVRISGIAKVAMTSNNLGNYFLFYASALSGIAVTMILCHRVRRVSFLNYLGIHSMAVMIYHKPILYLLRLLSGGAVGDGSRLSGLLAATAAIVLILPIIRVGRKHAPWLIGSFPTRSRPAARLAVAGTMEGPSS